MANCRILHLIEVSCGSTHRVRHSPLDSEMTGGLGFVVIVFSRDFDHAPLES